MSSVVESVTLRLTGLALAQDKNEKELFIVSAEVLNDGHAVDVIQMRWYYTEASEQYTDDKLRIIGFNGDPENPGFNPGPYAGYRKLDVYDGKERWQYDLSTSAAPLPKDRMSRARSKFRAKGFGTGAMVPQSSAPTPPPAPTKSAPPPAPPASVASGIASVKDYQSAWEYYSEACGNRPDAFIDELNALIDELGYEQDSFTVKDWQKLAGKGIPF